MLAPLAALAALAASTAAQASSYAPTIGACPSTSILRQTNGSISSQEEAFISARLQAASSAWSSYGQMAGYQLSSPPRTGLACSGGGYRASLYCAGVLSAFDSRNSSSRVAGVLDKLAYLTCGEATCQR